MSLPKLDVPIYQIELASTKQTITYRPFLVKEEKILLLAMESDAGEDILKAVQQIISNCIVNIRYTYGG